MGRDLLIFFAISALPIASYLLTEYPNTQFYLSLLLISLVVTVWFRLYYKEPDQLIDYDENLTLYSLSLIMAGALGIVVVGSIWLGAFSKSLIYVPTYKIELTIGTLQLGSFFNNILFQLVLVAPSEEVTKLVTHLSFYIWLRDKFSKNFAKAVSIGAPIGFWALLHTYQNPSYMGSNMWVAVSGAFLGGLIIFAVMHYTKSLLAAILTHFTYNAIIIYGLYYLLKP
jgi:membrane protease YdiL (CAAX protease family)